MSIRFALPLLLLATAGCDVATSHDVSGAEAASTDANQSGGGGQTPGAQQTGTLQVQLTGFGKRVGSNLRMAALDGNGQTLGTPVSTTIASDTFYVNLAVAATAQVASVAVLVDVNHNAHCDTVPRDGGWVLPYTSGGLALDANDAQSDVCNTFPVTAYNLWVNGDSDHEGRNVRGALVDDQNHVVGSIDTTVLNSSYAFVWPGALSPGRGYTVYWFIDLVQSGVCELFPGDFVYTQSIAPVTDDVALVVGGDNRVRTDLCSYLGHYGATLNFSGAAANANKIFVAKIFDTQSADPVDGVHGQKLSGTTAEVQWSSILNASRTYAMAAYVDVNASGACDRADPQWVVNINNPPSAVAARIDTSTAQDPNACAYFTGSSP